MSEQQPQFSLQRIYVKDMSFEAPGSPFIFQQDWAPKVNLDLNSNSQQIAEDLFEVVVSLTVTVTNEEEGQEEPKTAFLVEVQQAGLFTVAGIEGQQLAQVLNTTCPQILFPYARETISSLVVKGTFPQLNLAPVNFDALFMNYLQNQAQANPESTEA